MREHDPADVLPGRIHSFTSIGIPSMTVRPLHDRLIVQRLDEGEQQIGGIIIPDTAREAAAGHGHPSSATGK